VEQILNIIERVKQLTERALERQTADRAPRLESHVDTHATTVTGVTPHGEPDLVDITRANSVWSAAGVRLMDLDGVPTIGVWSDLDGSEIRAALRTLGSDRLCVRYLDGAGIPMHYKARRVEGEPVPMNVLNEMERQPEEPWNVRDRMLKELGWRSKGIAWAERKASELNRLFQEQGLTGEAGCITAATVMHCERSNRGKQSWNRSHYRSPCAGARRCETGAAGSAGTQQRAEDAGGNRAHPAGCYEARILRCCCEGRLAPIVPYSRRR